MSPAEQIIRDANATWIDAVNAGNLDLLMTMITDDVVFLNPGQAPFGGKEFRRNFEKAVKQIHFRCVSDVVEAVVFGDVAYTRCKDSLTVTPRAGGDTARFAGDRLTIYRKQPDGRWLLARDAHTLTEQKE